MSPLMPVLIKAPYSKDSSGVFQVATSVLKVSVFRGSHDLLLAPATLSSVSNWGFLFLTFGKMHIFGPCNRLLGKLNYF